MYENVKGMDVYAILSLLNAITNSVLAENASVQFKVTSMKK
jgi:hypothetical protein